jgi:hypothetical protein
MKKKILMIANTDNLPGVPVDMFDYHDFFTSPSGGNWSHEEIEILPNPDEYQLFEEIAKIRNADYDYVITIFSGHGREAISGIMVE